MNSIGAAPFYTFRLFIPLMLLPSDLTRNCFSSWCLARRTISLAGAATSIIFVTCLSRHVFCRDKSRLAATKFLSRQKDCIRSQRVQERSNKATSSGRWKSLHSSTPPPPPPPPFRRLTVCNNHSICGVTKAIVPTIRLLVAASLRSKRVGLMIEMLVCGACLFDPNGLLSQSFFSEANRAYRPSKRPVNIGARFFGSFRHRRQASSLSLTP